MGITCNDEGRGRFKKSQTKKSNENNTPEYPSSREIKTNHSSIYEEKEKEYKKANHKINEQNQKLEEEKKKN